MRPTENVNADSLYHIYLTCCLDKYKNTREGDLLETRLKAKIIRKGIKAPTFNIYDINGELVSLNQFRGKYLLLNFWGTWCRPCIAEFRALTETREKYSEKEIEFIFFNLDKIESKFAAAREKYHLSYGYHIPRNEELIDNYKVSFIPRLFLISPDGIILYSHNEEKDGRDLTHLNSLLEQLLGEGS